MLSYVNLCKTCDLICELPQEMDCHQFILQLFKWMYSLPFVLFQSPHESKQGERLWTGKESQIQDESINKKVTLRFLWKLNSFLYLAARDKNNGNVKRTISSRNMARWMLEIHCQIFLWLFMITRTILHLCKETVFPLKLRKVLQFFSSWTTKGISYYQTFARKSSCFLWNNSKSDVIRDEKFSTILCEYANNIITRLKSTLPLLIIY